MNSSKLTYFDGGHFENDREQVVHPIFCMASMFLFWGRSIKEQNKLGLRLFL